MNIACLGPPPTFCDTAAQWLAPGEQFIFANTIADVFGLVRAGTAGRAVVPVESNVAGPVTATVAVVRAEPGVWAKLAEIWVPVRFGLFRREGDSAPLTIVHAHQMAAAQVQPWAQRVGVRLVPAGSNGAALAAAAGGVEAGVGAIGPVGASVAGLVETERDVQGHTNNRTRFALVARAADAPRAVLL